MILGIAKHETPQVQVRMCVQHCECTNMCECAYMRVNTVGYAYIRMYVYASPESYLKK